MGSRDKILQAVHGSQPPFRELPALESLINTGLSGDRYFLLDQYIATLQSIGGHCRAVSGFADATTILKEQFPGLTRVVSTLEEFGDMAEVHLPGQTVSNAADVELVIVPAQFGVAENGAVWLTDALMPGRVLPVICQHLVAVIRAADIVADMHEAYERIGSSDYGFGVFIAGPSKTADIEQSLVLGAHGPVSMTVLILI